MIQRTDSGYLYSKGYKVTLSTLNLLVKYKSEMRELKSLYIFLCDEEEISGSGKREWRDINFLCKYPTNIKHFRISNEFLSFSNIPGIFWVSKFSYASPQEPLRLSSKYRRPAYYSSHNVPIKRKRIDLLHITIQQESIMMKLFIVVFAPLIRGAGIQPIG